jgi:hypothetical protein
MEYVALAKFIIEFIKECRENRSKNDIEEVALNRPLGRWLIRKQLRDKGHRGVKLRTSMRTLKEATMTDTDVKAFIANALDQ